MAGNGPGRRAAAIATPLLIFFSVGEGSVRLYTRHHLVYDLEMTRYARELKIDATDPAIGHVHRPRIDHLDLAPFFDRGGSRRASGWPPTMRTRMRPRTA